MRSEKDIEKQIEKVIKFMDAHPYAPTSLVGYLEGLRWVLRKE